LIVELLIHGLENISFQGVFEHIRREAIWFGPRTGGFDVQQVVLPRQWPNRFGFGFLFVYRIARCQLRSGFVIASTSAASAPTATATAGRWIFAAGLRIVAIFCSHFIICHSFVDR